MTCCKQPPSGKRDPVIWTAACYDATTGDLVWGRGWPYYTGEAVHQAFTEFRHTAGFVAPDGYRDVWRVDTQRLLDAETGEISEPPIATEPADGRSVVGTLQSEALFVGGNLNQGHVSGALRIDPDTGALLWSWKASDTVPPNGDVQVWGKCLHHGGELAIWWHLSRHPATGVRNGVLAAFESGVHLWTIDFSAADADIVTEFAGPEFEIEQDWWDLLLRPDLLAGLGGGFDPGEYDPDDVRILRQGATLYSAAASAAGVVASWIVEFSFDGPYPTVIYAVPVIALHDWSDGSLVAARAFPLRDVTPPVADWKEGIDLFAASGGEGVYGRCPDQIPGETGLRYLRINGIVAEHLARNCWPAGRQYFLPAGDASGYVIEYHIFDAGSAFAAKPRVVLIEDDRVTWQRQWPHDLNYYGAVVNAAVHESGDLIVLVSNSNGFDPYVGAMLTRLSRDDGSALWSIPAIKVPDNSWSTVEPFLAGHTREAFGPLTISGDRIYLYGYQLAHQVERTATAPGEEWDLLEACAYYYYGGGGPGGTASLSTDSFTGPNGQILGAGPPHHAPESGPGWTLGPPDGPGYASLQGGRLYTPLDPIGETDSWIIRYLNGPITGAGQSQVSIEFEGTPLGNPQQAGVLFRLGVSLGTSGFLAVLETHSGGTDLRVSLYELADHPSFGGSGGMPFPLATASVGVTSGGTLTVHDDGAWIGIDFNGVRKVTYQTSDHTSGSRRQGLFAYGQSGVYFDDWKVRGTAGCSGSGDFQWDDNAGEWSPLSGEDCTCSLLPPIRPGDFDEEIEAGRCGNWI